MDSKLFQAVMTGDITSLRELASSDSSVLLQVTTQGENTLHVAIKYRQEQMVEEIINLLSSESLMNQQNSKGDTPLHIAARLGIYQIAQTLLDHSSLGIESGEGLIRMTNIENDTALHLAVRKGHLQVVDLLLRRDPELALLTDEVGESPLFIAVDKNYVDVAKRILELPLFSYHGSNNTNVLHAIVVRSQDKVVRLPLHGRLFPSYGSRHDSLYEDFVELLIRKCQSALSQTDENEWTPLHYGVHFGALDIVRLFLRYINPSTAYIRDKEGMSVLHIAAREGEVIILEVLANHFPQIWDLKDNKGQTILHLAVARKNLNCVKFILGKALSHDDFINQQDNEGNTAFHLAAAIPGKILKLLIDDTRIDKTVKNKEGFTVIDLLLDLKEYDFFERKERLMVRLANNGGLRGLVHAINKGGREAGPIKTEEQPQQSEPTNDPQVEPAGKKKLLELYKILGNMDWLVATLVCGVSFAASMTMPGGYKSDSPDQGGAILQENKSFVVSVVANAVAFCSSATAVLLHYLKAVSAFTSRRRVHPHHSNVCHYLSFLAIAAMGVAFSYGSHATLSGSPWLADLVFAIGMSAVVLVTFLYSASQY